MNLVIKKANEWELAEAHALIGACGEEDDLSNYNASIAFLI